LKNKNEVVKVQKAMLFISIMLASAMIAQSSATAQETITGEMNYEDAREHEAAGDLVKARNRYNVGCLKTHIPSCDAYGVMNRDGKGGPIDLGVARDAFMISCEEGSDDSCGMLAELYETSLQSPEAGGISMSIRDTLEEVCELNERARVCALAGALNIKMGQAQMQKSCELGNNTACKN